MVSISGREKPRALSPSKDIILFLMGGEEGEGEGAASWVWL